MSPADKAALVQKLGIGGAAAPTPGQGLTRVRGAAASGMVAPKIAKAAAKKSAKSSGGGGFLGTGIGPDVSASDIMNGPVHTVLGALDEGRRLVQGSIGVAGETLRNTAEGKDPFKYDKLVSDLYGGKAGFGTIYQHDLNNLGLDHSVLANKWVKRAVGFAGDVATDPLVYLAPAEVLEGGAKAVAGRLGSEEVVNRIGQDAADSLIAKVGKDGASALSPEEVKAAFGTTGGLKLNVPGTGRLGRKIFGGDELHQLDLLPQELTNKVTRPLAGLRTAARDAGPVSKVLDQISGTQRDLAKGFQSGDPARAADSLKAMRVNDLMNSVSRTTANSDLKTYVNDIAPKIKGNEAAVIKAVESGNVEGVQGAAELRDFLQAAGEKARAAGVPMGDLGDQYVPRSLTDEGRAHAQTAGGGGTAYDPTTHRVLTPTLGGSQADTRASMEQFAKETLGFKGNYFETNPDKLIPAYVEALQRKTAYYGTINQLKDAGVVKSATEPIETLDKAGTKAAQKAAGLKDAKAAARAAGGSANDAAATQAQSAQDLLARAYQTPTQAGPISTAAEQATATSPDLAAGAASLDARATEAAGTADNQTLADIATDRSGKHPAWKQVTVAPTDGQKAARVRWTLDGVEGAPVGTKNDLRAWARDELGKQGVDVSAMGRKAKVGISDARTATDVKSAMARSLNDAIQTGDPTAIQEAVAAAEAHGGAGLKPAELADALQQAKMATDAVASGAAKPGVGIVGNERDAGAILGGIHDSAGATGLSNYISGGKDNLPRTAADVLGPTGGEQRLAARQAAAVERGGQTDWANVIANSAKDIKAAGGQLTRNADGTLTITVDSGAQRVGGLVDDLQHHISQTAAAHGVNPDDVLSVKRDVATPTLGGGRKVADVYTINPAPFHDAELAREVAGPRPALAAANPVAHDAAGVPTISQVADTPARKAAAEQLDGAAPQAVNLASNPEALAAKAADVKQRAFAVGSDGNIEQTSNLAHANHLYQAAMHEANPELRQVAILQAQRAEADAAYAASKGAVKDITSISKYKIEHQMIDALQSGAYHTLTADPTLAGTADIAKFLEPVQRVSTPEGMRNFMKFYDRALNYVKAWQIATPGFAVRNFMGGAFNNYLAGIDMGAYSRWYSAAKGAGTEAENAAAEEVRSALGMRGQYSAAELGRSGAEKPSIFQKLNPFGTKNVYVGGMRNLGEHVMEFHRGALGLDVMMKGGTLEDAVAAIKHYHFDYNDLSGFEKGLKKVVPFYTWTRQNFPLQIQGMLEHPGHYSWYTHLEHNLSAGSPKDNDIPGYFKDLFAIPTGIKGGGGQMYATPDLPFTRTLQNAIPFEDGHPSLNPIASMMTPLLKTPIERAMNHQFFKDIPLTDKTAPMPGAWAAIPGLKPALQVLGAVDSKGNMSERANYTVEQYLPLLARLQRQAPSDAKNQNKALTSWLSFVGVPLRTLTPQDQKNARFAKLFSSGKLKDTSVITHPGQKYAYVGPKKKAG